MENLKAKTAEKLIKVLIDKDAVVQTEKSTTYADFAGVHVKEYHPLKEERKRLTNLLDPGE